LKKAGQVAGMLLLVLVMFGCNAAKNAGDNQIMQPAADPKAEASVFPFQSYVELPANHYVEAMEALSDSELRVKLTDIATSRSYYARIDMNTKAATRTENAFDEPPPGDWEAKYRNPLWLTDGSGFYYLHSTGVPLGDGAGDASALAHYDIATGISTILPYEQGMWGGLSWLTPDESIVASNGYDDVVGLKIIHLADGTEKQIIETSDFEYLDYVIHQDTGRLLLSDHGKFSWYDSKGNMASQMDWPVEMDEFTRKNPDYSEGGNPSEQPFYAIDVNGGKVGPHGLRLSPDGQRLSYLLGAIGESIEDKVPGNKIVISRHDGTEPAYALSDYVRVSTDYAWSPSSKRIFVVFSTDADRERAYVGMIEAPAMPEEPLCPVKSLPHTALTEC